MVLYTTDTLKFAKKKMTTTTFSSLRKAFGYGLMNHSTTRCFVRSSLHLIWRSQMFNPDVTRRENSTFKQTFRLYVGNLDEQVTWQDLKDHFKQTDSYVVRANIKTDTLGNPLGWGLVEYSTLEDAVDAIEKLDQSVLMGKTIRVREDRNQQAERIEDSGPAADKRIIGRGSLYGAKLGVSCTVYVGNLSYQVTWEDLKDHMRQAGNVVRANLIKDADGRSRGCGLVDYETVEEANQAISTLHDTKLKGRLIYVREDRDKDVNNPNSRANYQV